MAEQQDSGAAWERPRPRLPDLPDPVGAARPDMIEEEVRSPQAADGPFGPSDRFYSIEDDEVAGVPEEEAVVPDAERPVVLDEDEYRSED